MDGEQQDDEIVARWRSDTPGCARRNHLNNAGASLMTASVIDAIQSHIALKAITGGYEAEEAAREAIEASYTDIAALLNAPRMNVAVMANATAAFTQALSTIDWNAGDTIVTTRCDYASNQIQYLVLQERLGVTVRHAADLPGGGVDPDSVRYLLKQHTTRLVACSWVPTNSGLVQDVESIGAICREFDVPFLIDACQAIGQINVDVQQLQCDYLSATARKFLRGPRGIGFLYASDRALARGDYPLFIDMRGARWTEPHRFEIDPTARRFEDWEFPYALVLGQGAAARYALEVGVKVGGERAFALADHAWRKLAELDGVALLDRGRQPCAIVTADIAP